MNGENLGTIIVMVVVGLPLFIMTGFLLKGRGANLVAGYNTMPKSEKAKCDTVAMCKFVGKILLGIDVLMVLLAIGMVTENDWMGYVFAGGVLILSIVAVVYSSTNNRFKK